MAFLRYFPGHEGVSAQSGKSSTGPWVDDNMEFVRSEARYFGRLTPLATWRSEYLLRTRLLRGLARGKPGTGTGGIGSSSRSGRKISAVLTYNSKLPWAVTNLHAVFVNGKKPPRAVHGTADLGVSTMSDPLLGKVEKWGFVDPFSTQQLDEVFPQLELWGVADGPAASLNVMDVSTAFGTLAGEGFPGGRAYYRPITEMCGRYIGSGSGVVDTYPDIPKIPELSEAISAVWLAKSSAVPSMTSSMVGMLTGSTLGVVTAYALGWDSSGTRFSSGDMTARWVLSPGVPIVSLRIDEQYNQRRKTAKRVWAVALNALGEVFYLCDTPQSTLDRSKGEDITKNAWYAGRSAYWHIIEHTRRQARPDELDKNAFKGSYSPRSPSDAMKLSKEQLIAEAREIDKFLRYKPCHFRRVCEGWDMQRRLEVDFAASDDTKAGEVIVVITRGWEHGPSANVSRYVRSTHNLERHTPTAAATPEAPVLPPSTAGPSIFGALGLDQASLMVEGSVPTAGETTPVSPPSSAVTPPSDVEHSSDWHVGTLSLGRHGKHEITATALEDSLHAAVTLFEDPLNEANKPGTEIPGRRARMLAVGTKNGAALVWNVRDPGPHRDINPVRIIQTESPEISCLALNGLYLVHGGSDGLVQAWDPLASTFESIRTLNARPSGRVPRHMMTMNPGLSPDSYSAARTIFLDPDPTILRGIVAFGSFLRYWSYSATSQSPGRKRRLRHSDIHGRLASRRQGGRVSGYIAAEAAELRREQEHRERERARLQNRFGVGAFGDMTEEEYVRYAQMISEEAYLVDEQRRTSASDTGSAADNSFDTASSFSESTASTLTPEPSVSGASFQPPATVEEESEYEMQVQQALRLSLLEGVNDHGHSPQGNVSGDYEVPITYKPKSAKKSKRSASASPSASQAVLAVADASSSNQALHTQEEDDLALALKLSMEEHALASAFSEATTLDPAPREEFPALEPKGKGKGRQL